MTQQHPDDRVRSMRDPAVRERRRAMLDAKHVAPLVKYASKLASMGRGDVPMPDPFCGGINAQVLFLYEKAGPKADASGFLSLNNDDPTAEATTGFLKQIEQAVETSSPEGSPRAGLHPHDAEAPT